MSKSDRCFYAVERMECEKPTYMCYFTYLTIEECKSPEKYKECEIWKKMKGTVIAL